MKITFLIGNGFDLQLGLRTSYPDFLSWYVAIPSSDIDILTFRQKLKDEESNSLWWSDAEIAMGNMFGEYTSADIDKFYKCIRDFKQQLAEYLRQEQSKCNYDDKDKIAKGFLPFLRNHQSEIMLNQNRNYLPQKTSSITYNFVNFNYTNTLSGILRCCGGEGTTIGIFNYGGSAYNESIGHEISVHGTLSSSIIMGVNDEQQVNAEADALTAKARRALIKPYVNNQLGRTEDQDAETIIANSDSIVIYGLSLGVTDQKWWNLLREWMIRSSNHKIVWFTRSGSNQIDPTIPEDLLDYVEEQRDIFLRKLKVSEEHKSYTSIRERIFIIRDTKKLNLTIIKKEPALV